MTEENEAVAEKIAPEKFTLNNRCMVATGEITEVRMCHIEEKDKGKISALNVKGAVQVQGNLLLRGIVRTVKRIVRYRARA